MSIRSWAKRALFGEPATGAAAWRGKANGDARATPGVHVKTIYGDPLSDVTRGAPPTFDTEEGPMTAAEYAAWLNRRDGAVLDGHYVASADGWWLRFYPNKRGPAGGYVAVNGDAGGPEADDEQAVAADDEAAPPPVLRWRCETDDRTPVFIYARTMIDAKEMASDHFGVWDVAVDAALAPLEDEVVTVQDGRINPGAA